MSEPLRRLFLSNAGADDIHAQAMKEGMITMRRDGMIKVREGLTTPYEVMRNVYSLTH